MKPLLLEEKDPEYQYPWLFGKLGFSSTSTISSLELLHYPDLKFAVLEPGNVSDESLPDWISKAESTPNVSNEGLGEIQLGEENLSRCSLRLLYGRCSFDTEVGLSLPLSEPSFELIKEHLGLPTNFLDLMPQKGAPAFKHTSSTRDGMDRTCFVFKIVMPLYSYYHLALSYNSTTRVTSGLLLCKVLRANKDPFPSLIKRLKLTPEYMDHPLYLATQVIEVVVSSYIERIQTRTYTLSELEEDTGQHEYENLEKGDPEQIDFMTMTRKLNFVARNLGSETMHLNWILLTLKKIAKYTEDLAGTKASSLSENSMNSEYRCLRKMEEDNECLENACETYLFRVNCLRERKESLLQVVYQFIAHNNAKVNIRLQENTSTIAIENKKDGASMKTIAMLWMIFLPGTFLATVFGMSVLDWEENGALVIKPGFKYYCIATAALTIFVLLLWALAMAFGSTPRAKGVGPKAQKTGPDNV